ncbi:hypothetical protein HPB49_007031 [Dermacentor silvarum]|uniref:Uncharacterized protein n=1 Tax=Dermacentor silvarum TaxID=543639 RepID=A0ACB8CW12_DERSI|nr:hypothetical protein HPB49_007031 [Dermacentor silvarum]
MIASELRQGTPGLARAARSVGHAVVDVHTRQKLSAHQTGDAGYYDDDGRLYILDRLKQMIKCMGNQVVPAELEELLLRQHADEIAEVSVVGLPHSDYGEAAAAAIVLTEKGRMQDLPTLAERIKVTVASKLFLQTNDGYINFWRSRPL